MISEYIRAPYIVIFVEACVDGVEPVFVIEGLFIFIKLFAPISMFAAFVIDAPIVMLDVVVLDSYAFVSIEPPAAVDIDPVPVTEISPDVVIFPEPLIYPNTFNVSPDGS